MAWSKAVEAIANSVSEISKTVAAYGPNDEGKVVKAAKQAGNKAKRLVEKEYPKCETTAEYKRKIEPLGIASSRAEYNSLRAKEINNAYKEAYDQVMLLYHERLITSANGTTTETAQSILNQDVAADTISTEMKSANSGCMGFALALVVSAGSLISGLIYCII